MNPKSLRISATLILTGVSLMAGCASSQKAKHSSEVQAEINQANAEADEFAALFVKRSLAYFGGGGKSEAVEVAWNALNKVERATFRREAAKFLSREESELMGKNVATFFDDIAGREFLTSLRQTNKELFRSKNMEPVNKRLDEWHAERMKSGSADAGTDLKLRDPKAKPGAGTLSENHPNVAAAPYKHPELVAAIKQFLKNPELVEFAQKSVAVFRKSGFEIVNQESCNVIEKFKSPAARTNVLKFINRADTVAKELPARAPRDCVNFNMSVVYAEEAARAGMSFEVMENVAWNCHIPPAKDVAPHLRSFKDAGKIPPLDLSCSMNHAAAASIELPKTNAKLAQD